MSKLSHEQAIKLGRMKKWKTKVNEQKLRDIINGKDVFTDKGQDKGDSEQPQAN